MSLVRLAKELEETARQTGDLVDGITDALYELSSADARCEEARANAIQRIVIALQGQDRIEQRCRNMANAVRALVAADASIDHPRFDEIWSHLTLDELAVPELSGVASRGAHGDVDLF